MPEINPVRVHSPAPRLSDPHAPMPWSEQALCSQTDPDLWFPEQNRGSYTTIDGDRMSTAKAVCQRCPVQAECLEHAMTAREEYGIWGGTSANDRAQLRARQGRTE